MPTTARRRLFAILLATTCLALQLGHAAERPGSYAAALKSIRGGDMLRDVQFLADPEREGREAGSPGGYAAAQYLTARLAKLHLAPGGAQGYFQPFGPIFAISLPSCPAPTPNRRNLIS